jgi:membrane protease YdiL (CAAX protease family)
MQITYLAFLTPADAPRWKRILLSPLMRIVWFALMFCVFAYGIKYTPAAFGWKIMGSELKTSVWAVSILLGTPLLAYLVLVRLIEQRDVAELSLRKIPTLGGFGLVVGSLVYSTIVGVLWLLGSYHVIGTNAHPDWNQFLNPILWALAGEIVARGVLFRITEEGLGTWIALAISAAAFGIGHMFIPGAPWWSSVAYAVEGGLMLPMVYHLTRSLWACVGVHLAWNLMQGLVYGMPADGPDVYGLLESNRTGPDWLTGGSLGAEASVVSIAACGLCTIALVLVAQRRKSIVAPSWRRTDPTAPTGWDRLDKMR